MVGQSLPLLIVYTKPPFGIARGLPEPSLVPSEIAVISYAAVPATGENATWRYHAPPL